MSGNYGNTIQLKTTLKTNNEHQDKLRQNSFIAQHQEQLMQQYTKRQVLFP